MIYSNDRQSKNVNAQKKTIELRRCTAENPAVFAVNLQLYQA